MARLDTSRLPTFNEDDHVILEYIAVRTMPFDYICKTFVVTSEPKTIGDCLPRTISPTSNSSSSPDCILQPVFMCRDPFRKGRCKLVLCELCPLEQKTPSTRQLCKEEFEGRFKDEDVWLGFEQEYFLVDDEGAPYEWARFSRNPTDGFAYKLLKTCRDGEMRQLADNHLRACLYAGLTMGGLNREGYLCCWEYQLGPAPALDCVDQLLVSRFILLRECEIAKTGLRFCTPACGADMMTAASVLHVNMSTENMRSTGGIKYIHAALESLASHPDDKLLKYYDRVDGVASRKLLQGGAWMPHSNKFVTGIADKFEASVRIPALVVREKKGYFEERRVSVDVDPYVVARMLSIAALCPNDLV